MSPVEPRFPSRTRTLRTALSALLCLLVVATAAVVGNAGPAGAAAPTDNQLAGQAFAAMNAYRKAHHQPLLINSARLNAVARSHSAAMAAANQLSKQLPQEPALATRVKNAGVSASHTGENVGTAINPSTLMALVNKLIAAYPHFQYVGLGVVSDHVHHKIWLTQDFVTAAPPPVPVQTQIANGVLAMMNAQRAANGLPALKMNNELIASAKAHNLAMAAADSMQHQLPGELFFALRILQAGFNYLFAGENIGWNTTQTLAGAQYLQSLMYNEKPPDDGHRLNILNRNYTYVGIQVLFDAVHGKMWLTQDFGKPQ